MSSRNEYKIEIERKALKFIAKQPREQQLRILAAICKLPGHRDIKPLKGGADAFRLRVGSYRIIYRVDSGRLLVEVLDADSRGDIYKRY